MKNFTFKFCLLNFFVILQMVFFPSIYASGWTCPLNPSNLTCSPESFSPNIAGFSGTFNFQQTQGYVSYSVGGLVQVRLDTAIQITSDNCPSPMAAGSYCSQVCYYPTYVTARTLGFSQSHNYSTAPTHHACAPPPGPAENSLENVYVV